MKLSITTALLARLLLAVVLSASPLAAQQKRGTAPRKPAPAPPVSQPAEPTPTFDTLLADDSYKIYVEVRGVGQLLRSPAVNDLLEPITKIVGPSKEFNTLLKWLDARADSLAGSRLFVAGWPTQTKLPSVLLAIEFATPEEAKKFEPQLRRFIPTLMPPDHLTPEATPAPGAGQPPRNQATPQVQPQPATAPLPYHLVYAGSLVLLSDKPFAVRDLKPRNAKLLAEDQNFVTARNRFASESLFLYVDVKAIEKEDQDRRKKYEEENQRMLEQELSRAKEEQAAPSPEIPEPTIVEATELPTPEDPPPPATNGTATLSSSAQVQAPTATLSGQESGRDSALMNTLTYSLYGSLFGGQPKWPEAVAAALSFEGDAYVLRALVLNSAENKAVAVPFLPQLVSGPALVPASPAVLPAGADLFVSASLEYPQMYDGLLKSIARMNEQGRDYSMQAVNDAPVVSPFAEFEKKLGLKIKDDILPLLGNEVAVALVPKSDDDTPANPAATPAADTQPKVKPYDPDPVIAIAVKDKEAVRHLIPKLIDAMGLKGANLIAQTERKDDTETTTYAGMLTYAFVNDFLILSPNPAVVKRCVASYLAGETLSSSSFFRNASRWQSRQVQAQVYMAPVLVQRYGLGGANSVNEKAAELLAHVNLPIEPLTYSLSNEGSGPLHELHVPRNLLLLTLASISNDAKTAPVKGNEAAVINELRTLVLAEADYAPDTEDGHYGTLDELVKAELMSKEPLERFGYKLELTVSANKFQATAVPIEYGKSGNFSYFVDESGIMRGADHGGGPATIADPPIQ
jgi:hypothetical protein